MAKPAQPARAITHPFSQTFKTWFIEGKNTSVLTILQHSHNRAYYAWKKQPEWTEKAQQKERLEIKTRELLEASKHSYGTRRLSDALNKAGYQAGRDKVRRLMVQLGLEVSYPKRFKVTTDSDHHETISPNTLNREFEVDSPNTKAKLF